MSRPYTQELEYKAQELAGIAMLRPDLLPVASAVLNTPALTQGVFGEVWSGLRASQRNQSIEVSTLRAELSDKAWQWLAAGQRLVYTPQVVSAEDVQALAQEIADHGYRTQMEQIMRRAAEGVHDTSTPLDALVSSVMQEVTALKSTQRLEWRSMQEVVQSAELLLTRWEAGVFDGEPTGFKTLDSKIHAVPNGEVTIVAGRPSMGKTQLTIQILLNVARRYKAENSNKMVAIFSAETKGEVLAIRLACAIVGVDQNKLKSREATEEEKQRVRMGMQVLESLPFYFNEEASPTIDHMMMQSLVLNNLYKDGQRMEVGMIAFDFMELSGEKAEQENLRIARTMRGLKVIAKMFDVPLIALSQVSRAADGDMPKLKDLRWSGAIEQLAYLVLFIHRESYYKRREDWKNYRAELDPDRRIAIILVAKNKEGYTGPIPLGFREEHGRFYDFQDEPDTSPATIDSMPPDYDDFPILDGVEYEVIDPVEPDPAPTRDGLIPF